jgi:4-hydroxy-4-methyl-2-oxoglutarate aldolase
VIRTGDLIVSDADRVVALPLEIAARVLEQADARVRQEQDIFDRLRAGATTLDVYGLGGVFGA